MTDVGNQIHPLPFWGAAVLFGIPTLLMWGATRYWIAELRDLIAGPDILCWFIAGGSVFAGLFLAGFAGFWGEKGSWTFAGFAHRFRFHRLNAGDVAWSLGLLVVCGLLSAAILGLWRLASYETSFLIEPRLSPPFLHMEPLTQGTVWLLLAWLPLFFFNVVGEELWWRGYILPRQEQAHGSVAWVIHGLGLAVFHLPLGLDLTIILLPYLFALPYVVQRRRNLWTGILLHGILNGGGFLAVASGLA